MDSNLFSQIKASLSSFAPDSSLSHPPNSKFGHLSSNVAMIIAKKAKKNPMDIAKDIKKKLDKEGIIKQMKRNEYFEKPSQKRRRKMLSTKKR